MKIRLWDILPGILLLLGLTLLSWKDIQKGSEIPEEVSQILSSKCYACHTNGAGSEDALKAVDFKKWEEYSAVKKIGILNNIKEVMEEGKMPPQKYLNRYPEKALSTEQRESILEWTKAATAKLME